MGPNLAAELGRIDREQVHQRRVLFVDPVGRAPTSARRISDA